jgi:hypothetical protein
MIRYYLCTGLLLCLTGCFGRISVQTEGEKPPPEGNGLYALANYAEFWCGAILVIAIFAVLAVPALKPFTGRIIVATLGSLATALALEWLAVHRGLVVGISVVVGIVIIAIIAWKRKIPQDLLDDGKLNGSA